MPEGTNDPFAQYLDPPLAQCPCDTRTQSTRQAELQCLQVRNSNVRILWDAYEKETRFVDSSVQQMVQIFTDQSRFMFHGPMEDDTMAVNYHVRLGNAFKNHLQAERTFMWTLEKMIFQDHFPDSQEIVDGRFVFVVDTGP